MRKALNWKSSLTAALLLVVLGAGSAFAALPALVVTYPNSPATLEIAVKEGATAAPVAVTVKSPVSTQVLWSWGSTRSQAIMTKWDSLITPSNAQLVVGPGLTYSSDPAVNPYTGKMTISDSSGSTASPAVINYSITILPPSPSITGFGAKDINGNITTEPIYASTNIKIVGTKFFANANPYFAPAGSSLEVIFPGGLSKTLPDLGQNVAGDAVYYWTDNSIDFGIPASIETVPVVAGTYTVVVHAKGGTTSEAFAIHPRVDEAVAGAPGTKSVINGASFGTDKTKVVVTINGVAQDSNTLVVTNNSIQYTIPANLTTNEAGYPVKVTVNGLDSNTNKNLSIIVPVIGGIDKAKMEFPNDFNAGNTSFNITGVNFGIDKGSIEATLPNGAVTLIPDKLVNGTYWTPSKAPVDVLTSFFGTTPLPAGIYSFKVITSQGTKSSNAATMEVVPTFYMKSGASIGNPGKQMRIPAAGLGADASKVTVTINGVNAPVTGLNIVPRTVSTGNDTSEVLCTVPTTTATGLQTLVLTVANSAANFSSNQTQVLITPEVSTAPAVTGIDKAKLEFPTDFNTGLTSFNITGVNFGVDKGTVEATYPDGTVNQLPADLINGSYWTPTKAPVNVLPAFINGKALPAGIYSFKIITSTGTKSATAATMEVVPTFYLKSGALAGNPGKDLHVPVAGLGATASKVSVTIGGKAASNVRLNTQAKIGTGLDTSEVICTVPTAAATGLQTLVLTVANSAANFSSNQTQVLITPEVSTAPTVTGMDKVKLEFPTDFNVGQSSFSILGVNFGIDKGTVEATLPDGTVLPLNADLVNGSYWTPSKAPVNVLPAFMNGKPLPAGIYSFKIITSAGVKSATAATMEVVPTFYLKSGAVAGNPGKDISVPVAGLGTDLSKVTVTLGGKPAQNVRIHTQAQIGTGFDTSEVICTVPTDVATGLQTLVLKVNTSISQTGINVTTEAVNPGTTFGISTVYPDTKSDWRVGQTVILTGSKFGTSGVIQFTGTAGAIKANPVVWKDGQIVLTVPVGATSGNMILLTTGGDTATVAYTITGGIVMDDFEGGCVKYTDDGSKPNYYNFDSASSSPEANRTIDSANVYEGSNAMDVLYTFKSMSKQDWGGGWGAKLANPIDLSGVTQLVFFMKGDGSDNAVQLQLKDADGDTFVSPAFKMNDASGHKEITIQKDAFTLDTTSGVIGNSHLNAVTEYQFIYKTKAPSTAHHYIDSLMAGEIVINNADQPYLSSISPEKVYAGQVVTITGSNFGPAQETSKIYMSKINMGTAISWSDNQIVVKVPDDSTAGDYTISITRNKSDANNVVTPFESIHNVSLTVSGALAAGTLNAYPNPFNPNVQSIKFEFNPGTAANIKFYIFDINGHVVHVETQPAAGTLQSLTWNGKDDWGQTCGDGVYLVRLLDAGSGSTIAKTKVLLIKGK